MLDRANLWNLSLILFCSLININKLLIRIIQIILGHYLTNRSHLQMFCLSQKTMAPPTFFHPPKGCMVTSRSLEIPKEKWFTSFCHCGLKAFINLLAIPGEAYRDSLCKNPWIKMPKEWKKNGWWKGSNISIFYGYSFWLHKTFCYPCTVGMCRPKRKNNLGYFYKVPKYKVLQSQILTWPGRSTLEVSNWPYANATERQ